MISVCWSVHTDMRTDIGSSLCGREVGARPSRNDRHLFVLVVAICDGKEISFGGKKKTERKKENIKRSDFILAVRAIC